MKLALKILILIGIFVLPLINSRITNLLGFSFLFPVSGNYEFTKVIFFNIWASGVFMLFCINLLYKKVFLSDFSLMLIIGYIILIVSTYFSITPYLSFYGNDTKSHGFFMWHNLFVLFIILGSIFSSKKIDTTPQKKIIDTQHVHPFFYSIITTSIITAVCVGIIGIWQYFWPSYEYGNLSNRLFSTFGHPNYLSIIFVALMPFIIQRIQTQKNLYQHKILYFLVAVFLTFCLLFTKSLFAIFLYVLYIGFEILNYCKKRSLISSLRSFTLLGVVLLILGAIGVFVFLPEKLSSFVSRFYIWETVLKIIFSDIKFIIIGAGADTLVHLFDNSKSIMLYVYENIGFSADRPHNLILNFWFHFGFVGLIGIIALYYKVFREILLLHGKISISKLSNFTKNQISLLVSLALILVFLLLNFASVALYVFIVVILSYLFTVHYTPQEKISIELAIIPLLLLSLFGTYNSISFYYSETLAYKNKLKEAKSIYVNNPSNFYYTGDFDRGNILSSGKKRSYYYAKLQYQNNLQNRNIVCNEFTSHYNYAEIYIHCGNYLWNKGHKEVALKYYNSALVLLPDLWNKNSKYYSMFGITHFKVNGNRFLSEKFGLKKVLERTNTQITKK